MVENYCLLSMIKLGVLTSIELTLGATQYFPGTPNKFLGPEKRGLLREELEKGAIYRICAM